MRLIDIEPYEKLGYRHLIKLNGGGVESATYTPVDEIKTVDIVSTAYGYWIKHDYAEVSEGLLIPNYECSVCHSWIRDCRRYCGDCGAKMNKDSM